MRAHRRRRMPIHERCARGFAMIKHVVVWKRKDPSQRDAHSARAIFGARVTGRRAVEREA
jgi:hypothetical protein